MKGADDACSENYSTVYWKKADGKITGLVKNLVRQWCDMFP